MQSFVQARNKTDGPGDSNHNADESLESLRVVLQKKQPADRLRKSPQDVISEQNHSIDDVNDADRGRFESPPNRSTINQNPAITNTHITGPAASTRPSVLQEGTHPDRLQSVWSSQWHNDQDSTHDRLESVKRRKILAMKAGGLATSYIKGDSYAETTSGRLTEHAMQDHQSQRVSNLWQPPATSYHQQTYVRPTTEHEALLPTAQFCKIDRPLTSHIYQPHVGIDDDLANLEQLLPPFPGQPLSGQNQNANRHTLQENRHAEHAEHGPLQTTSVEEIAQPAKTAGTFNTGETSESRSSGERTGRSMTGRESVTYQSNTPSVRLQASDVDSRLFAMDYGTLQAQSFDEDSSEQIEEVPPIESFKTLHRLDELLLLEEDDQTNELKSLSIDAWEDIGSQLVQRFGDAFTRLTQIRQERRKAALAIEAELDQRHIFVTKKRKTIENSLVEMKSNGSQVLLKTPRKVSI